MRAAFPEERIPAYVHRTVRRLQDAGFDAYPVGGCVRDSLLGRRVADWDIATSARPEQVMALFDKVIPTGVEHGTVTVMSRSRPIEVTTFRGDVGYSDGRHPDGVVFLDSLTEDLARRDFTINAIAYDIDRKRIVDPFRGRRDLVRKRVRAVGVPLERFREDGLRPLRAVRFASVLGFDIQPATFRAIRESLDIFRKVAAERVREELIKILSVKRAARGIELLRESGLLLEILPELLACVGHPQNRFHNHDVYHHCLRCLDRARGDPVLKLAVLLHDVGKPEVAEGPPGEQTFYGHEQVSEIMADAIMDRLRFSKADRARVTGLIRHHMFHYEPGWTDGAVRRLVRRVGQERLDDLWEMRRADAWGRGKGLRESLATLAALKERVQRVLASDAVLKVNDLAIGGREVMEVLGCGPGPRVGRALQTLLDRVLDDPSLNRKPILVRMLEDQAGPIR